MTIEGADSHDASTASLSNAAILYALEAIEKDINGQAGWVAELIGKTRADNAWQEVLDKAQAHLDSYLSTRKEFLAACREREDKGSLDKRRVASDGLNFLALGLWESGQVQEAMRRAAQSVQMVEGLAVSGPRHAETDRIIRHLDTDSDLRHAVVDALHRAKLEADERGVSAIPSFVAAAKVRDEIFNGDIEDQFGCAYFDEVAMIFGEDNVKALSYWTSENRDCA